jgi:IS66 C-terminal element
MQLPRVRFTVRRLMIAVAVAAILLSVTQSAREQGLEPWSYIRDVLARVSTHPHSRFAELLPDRWGNQRSRSRPAEKHRKWSPRERPQGAEKPEVRPGRTG